MNIDKLIEEKTQCFTGNGDYYFNYVTPKDCKKIIEEVLKQGQLLPIDSVSDCVIPSTTMDSDICIKCGKTITEHYR